MSLNVVRSRIVSRLNRGNHCNDFRRLFSSDVPKKEPIIAAQTIAADLSAAAEATAAEEPASQNAGRKSAWRFLKYGTLAALTGATAGAGYVTYAYSTEEIVEKTKPLRESLNYSVGDDAPAVEKYRAMLYNAAMTVPAKAIELYLDLRTLVEEQVKGFTEPTDEKLLPDLHPAEQHVFTLVLDLKETLLYSDWKVSI
ncbi:hypothetical protein Patl1_03965 [Pistacia atlantica]|uniref:Uncharacterized protein n=1 Tax=Pistacia atlantica TaxID=434234 RepID=A0ACC1BRQ7_9ROSI|nr:hypothetical protein Patl1_03965 [Pistacia atlantica]